MSYNIGFINIKRALIIILIIVTLPDIWDIALSGKHDCYVLLFELTGIYLISLSIFCKNKFLKIFFSFSALLPALLSTTIRLSSIYLLLISIAFIIYNFYKYPINEIKKVFLNVYEHIQLSRVVLISLIITSSFSFGLLNYKFFSNPFYKLSPPNIVSSLFPNAQYIFDYELWKIRFSLKNIPFFIKPFFTFFYTTLGLEPVRYVSNKFSDLNSFLGIISSTLNKFGPKGIMVSLYPLSPFSILAYFSSSALKNKKRLFLLLLISIWILFWTISIPFTRVAIASFLSLVIFAFSDSNIFSIDNSSNKIKNQIKSIIISYGYITIVLFTIWSFSNLYGLPIGDLFKNGNYSRTSLTRKYIDLRNSINYTKVSPSLNFEKEWSNIEKNNNSKLLLLKDAPHWFVYFMNKGIIVRNLKEIAEKNKEITLCYKIDYEQNIYKSNCS